MGTVEGWKRLIAIEPSPSNGITFDCGVTREMGQDPVEVCRYFGSRDCINHVHYRNVRVSKPYEKYTDVFIDEGQVAEKHAATFVDVMGRDFDGSSLEIE
jgi:mannonate dehydratase